MTEGGIQSNHVRQVTAAATKVGLKVVLLIKDLVPEKTSSSNPQRVEYTELGNVQLTHLMSAVHRDGSEESRAEVLQSLTGYWIPSGASTHPLGGLGYARWAFELEEQECKMGIFFDVIILALMSGSTLAGIVAGMKLLDKIKAQSGAEVKKRRLIGVQAGPKEHVEMLELVLRIARTTAEKIGLPGHEITEADFEIDNRWHGGAYGRLDQRTREHVKLAASTEGLIVDPVYSGKAFTAMSEMTRAGEVKGNVLFVHTGGIMSLSAYPELR